MILPILLNGNEPDNQKMEMTFNSGAEFEAERNRILRG
jgi:hypothetical protein